MAVLGAIAILQFRYIDTSIKILQFRYINVSTIKILQFRYIKVSTMKIPQFRYINTNIKILKLYKTCCVTLMAVAKLLTFSVSSSTVFFSLVTV